VAAAVLIDWNRPSIYQASSRLMVNPARPGDLAPPPTPGTLQTMVTSQTVVSQALHELGLSAPPHNLTVNGTIGRIAVRPLPDTSFLEITARLDDADLAARLANRLADGVVSLASQTVNDDAVKVR